MTQSSNFLEKLYPSYGQQFKVDEVLFEVKTEHQHLIVFENAMFGRVMALDGIIQTTQNDEFIYHEMMTHVPVLAHGKTKSVLIIGGGDGGILRETVKHSNIEKIVQVEIDAAVIDTCKKYLPGHSDGAFDDPRVQIVIDDGVEYVNNTDQTFDIVISDSTDPIGPGEVLYTSRYYQGCKRCLNPGGIMVAQNGVAFMQMDETITTFKRFQPTFKAPWFYTAAVPTYIGGVMSFAFGSDQLEQRQIPLDELTHRYKTANINTRYYTSAIHQASFALPKYIEDSLLTAK